jgi:DNA-binding transcriptional ArsR family regulator
MEQAHKPSKLLRDPIRLRIANPLSLRSPCVSDLQPTLGPPWPFVSKCLTLLRMAGLARTERQGPLVRYPLICSADLGCPLDLLLKDVPPFTPTFQSDVETLDQYEVEESGEDQNTAV